MLDIKLCESGDFAGDLDLTEDGDIQIGNDVLQNARTAILWILGEWQFGPELGLPWFDDILVKRPNIDLIRQEIRDALLGVDDVSDADVELTEFDTRNRRISFNFTVWVGEESYSEEVTVGG